MGVYIYRILRGDRIYKFKAYIGRLEENGGEKELLGRGCKYSLKEKG